MSLKSPGARNLSYYLVVACLLYPLWVSTLEGALECFLEKCFFKYVMCIEHIPAYQVLPLFIWYLLEMGFAIK